MLDLPDAAGRRRAVAAGARRERGCRCRAARRELIAARHVPYTALVAPEVAAHRRRAITCRRSGWRARVRVGRRRGVNAWHERLNALWRNLASPHVAVWVHVLRRRERGYPPGEFPPGFARELNERYRARLAGETLMVNELYVSLVYRPQPTLVGAAALALFRRTDKQGLAREVNEALEACEKLRGQVLAGLAATSPRRWDWCPTRRTAEARSALL